VIALLSMAIIVVAASTRLFLGPLLYFLTCVPAFVLFTVLRRKAAYISLVIAPLLPIIVESIALLTGNFRGGFLVGDIVCLVTALLGATIISSFGGAIEKLVALAARLAVDDVYRDALEDAR